MSPSLRVEGGRRHPSAPQNRPRHYILQSSARQDRHSGCRCRNLETRRTKSRRAKTLEPIERFCNEVAAYALILVKVLNWAEAMGQSSSLKRIRTELQTANIKFPNSATKWGSRVDERLSVCRCDRPSIFTPDDLETNFYDVRPLQSRLA